LWGFIEIAEIINQAMFEKSEGSFS